MNVYFTKEEKGKEALLFLHGWGCDGNVFRRMARSLPYLSIVPDLWGFGKSPSPPPQGWSVADYCNALSDFLAEQGVGKVTIVAHSFGARIAVYYAATHSKEVCAMVLTGAAGLRRFSLSRMLKILRYKRRKKRGKASEKCGSTDYRSADPAMRNTLVKVVNFDLSNFAKKITCPVLLVWGEEDVETPLWMAKKYRRLIKNSTLVTLPGGHFAFAENFGAFGKILQVFCAEYAL